MGTDSEVADTLIAQIYDTALDPTQWPLLLDQIVTTIAPLKAELTEVTALQVNEGHSVKHFSDAQIASASYLFSHLERSAQISEKLTEKATQQRLQSSLLELLPLPSFVLSNAGKLLHSNRMANEFLQATKLIKVTDESVSFLHASQQRQFDRLLDSLEDPSTLTHEVTMRVQDSFTDHPITLNLSKIDDQLTMTSHILILVANYDLDKKIDLTSFSQMFSLTKAEQKVVEKLIRKKTLNEIGVEHNVSIHTVRSQLKSIFNKTDCHRQSDLIKLILTNPNADIQAPTISKPLYQQEVSRYHLTHSPKLDRKIGYSDIGRKSAIPVIMMPPSTGSRLQQHPDIKSIFNNNIRLITIDRPGFGLSTAQQNRGLIDIVKDVEELANHLKLDTFSVAGYCGGGPYALAVASKLTDRVQQAALISSVTPYEAINLFHGVKSSNKLLAQLALKAPRALYPMIKIVANNLLRDHEKYFDQVYPHLCKSDAAALSEPVVTDNFLLAFREALRQGPEAFCQDLIILSNDWGLNLAEINVPVSVWHGGSDQHVPIQLARKLQQSIGNSQLIEIEEHGHFMVYHRWNEILQSFSARG